MKGRPDGNQTLLNKMHLEPCDLFQIKNRPIFDPHMTLFCIDQKMHKAMISAHTTHQALIADNFILSLGECDDIGRLTKIIF